MRHRLFITHAVCEHSIVREHISIKVTIQEPFSIASLLPHWVDLIFVVSLLYTQRDYVPVRLSVCKLLPEPFAVCRYNELSVAIVFFELFAAGLLIYDAVALFELLHFFISHRVHLCFFVAVTHCIE